MTTGIRILTSEELYASARVAYRYAGSNIAIVSGDPWRWDTLSANVAPVGNWELSPTTYAVKSPVDGFFCLEASALSTNSNPVDHANNSASFRFQLSDDNIAFTTIKVLPASADGLRNAYATASFDIKAGQWVRVINDNVAFTQQSDADRFFTIHRIGDYSHRAPVGTVIATPANPGLSYAPFKIEGTGTTVTNDTTTDITGTSFSLPAGTYSMKILCNMAVSSNTEITRADGDVFLTDSDNNVLGSGIRRVATGLRNASGTGNVYRVQRFDDDIFILAANTSIKMRGNIRVVGGSSVVRTVENPLIIVQRIS